ncbi:FAD-dependent thymidylate synthase [Streptomyces diastaticus]|uniref:FAD-dependent thymidylate synthase n=1 Tax=Streptomyces diastaticus TaxID=1956 RepID=UPI0037FF4A43
MKISVLAHTMLNTAPLLNAYGYRASGVKYNATVPRNADALAEAAGRICYKSFNRPNPATASNADYLANILAQGHHSVLEHASATFLVQGVSRALLTELTRHRHLSFSVVSQRYVNYADTEPIMPPAVADDTAESVRHAYMTALEFYESLAQRLTAQGLSRKQAREAARCVLPNAAPVDMIVTGNMRAWRDVLGKRWHVAADAEIREFAGEVLACLSELAPNSFQDIPNEPYGSDGK